MINLTCSSPDILMLSWFISCCALQIHEYNRILDFVDSDDKSSKHLLELQCFLEEEEIITGSEMIII